MLTFDPAASGRLRQHSDGSPRCRGRDSSELTSRERDDCAAALETQRRENAETTRELEWARHRYATLYERAPIGYLTLTPRGRILHANGAASALLGIERNLLRAQCLADLVTSDQAEPLRHHMRSALRSDATIHCELRLRSPDGRSRVVAATLTPDVDVGGRRRTIIAGLTDVTTHRHLEAELRHAQKMEALGRLAAGVAHDMNNLLMAILGCAELAARSADENSRAQGYLAELKRVVQSGAHVVRQLNVWTRKRPPEAGTAALDETVGRVETMLSPLLGDDMVLVVRSGATGARVSCSSSALEQILLNLALNARDAMPEGGTLSFVTSRSDEADSRAASGGWARLVVRDDGRGMDETVRERLFEPFFTTKGDAGTGLGLSTVYAIVQQAGGRIVVDSEPGRGTAFTIDLPDAGGASVTNDPEDGRAPATPPPTRHASPLTVLVVEDQPLVRMTARSYLERAGHHVLEAGDADGARRTLAAHGGTVDLLLTDVVLSGGMAGPVLADQLAERLPHVRVVFMSAYPRSFLLSRHCIPDDAPSLEKPFSRDDLQQALAAALASPSPRRPEA